MIDSLEILDQALAHVFVSIVLLRHSHYGLCTSDDVCLLWWQQGRGIQSGNCSLVVSLRKPETSGQGQSLRHKELGSHTPVFRLGAQKALPSPSENILELCNQPYPPSNQQCCLFSTPLSPILLDRSPVFSLIFGFPGA